MLRHRRRQKERKGNSITAVQTVGRRYKKPKILKNQIVQNTNTIYHNFLTLKLEQQSRDDLERKKHGKCHKYSSNRRANLPVIATTYE